MVVGLRRGLSVEVTFKQRSKGREEGSSRDTYGQTFPCRKEGKGVFEEHNAGQCLQNSGREENARSARS